MRSLITVFAPVLALGLATPAVSQTPAPSAILVLDGSGSMWGQIDGVNKIVIAREVVANLLGELPGSLQLGLTVYGHRTRGDCTDIQTIIEPGANNRANILAAVRGINPRGRTPMTQAVVEAARVLRHTEEPATVILVSDGIETCEADPCAIAAELEAAGVNFTAHVVGFDVRAEPEARAQMQCIADVTGGRFLTADNADELAAALTEVAATVTAAAPTPAPEPVAVARQVLFSAVEEIGTTREGLSMGVVFEVLQGAATVRPASDNSAAALLPGAYVLRATRVETEQTVDVPFTVIEGADQIVEVVFQTLLPTATLSAPTTGAAGSTITVDWTGPNADGDYLSTAQPGAPALSWVTFANAMDGTPAALRLPPQPGAYVIRYVLAGGAGHVLAEVPVTVTAAQSALSAPDTAPIGATIQIDWTAAGHSDDWLSVAPAGAPAGHYINFVSAADGNPATLRMPTTPGAYEIRYITGQDTSVFASLPIQITDVPATLTAPASAAPGSVVSVRWTGPGNPGDYLTVATMGDGPLGYVTYAYVEGGKAVDIAMPDAPGRYVLRYIADGRDARVLAEQPIELR